MDEASRTRWREVEEIVGVVLEAAAADRDDSIERLCAGRADLADEVRSLVAAAEGADEFFEALAAGAGAAFDRGDAGAVERPDLAVGRVYGSYRLVRRIGAGGMGAVYYGERADDLFRKSAAIKLLPSGVAGGALDRRFAAERRILARLQHPAIASLLDGGVSYDGVPYFVMEYVDGRPIDRFCDEGGLTVADRLRLFLQVCEAVDHAHRNLVVHRDLKPSNILVTAAGGVKLLDFGIATLLEREAGDAERPVTEMNGGLTPAYASPEQIRGERLTTATDVYSLGVLLYRLLAGRRPYDVAGLSPAEVERVVALTVPPLPSEAADRPPDAMGERSQRGGSTSGRRLRGDLDTIVMKALHKEPARRYASVRALADDIERHLAGYPVHARPDSFRYRASRFVARNRPLVAAGAAVALFMVGFSALATYTAVTTRAQNAVIVAERDRARLEAEKADAVSSFLVNLFGASDPDVAAGESVTAFELLEQGARNAGALESQPAVRARMLDVIAQVYTRLGAYDRAEGLFRDAMDAYGASGEAASVERTAVSARLAEVLRRAGRTDEAVPLFEDAIARSSGEPVALANVLNDLGLLEYDRGAYGAAERLHRRALGLRQAALGERHARTAVSLQNLALAVAGTGRTDEAERLYREALVIYRETYGDEHTEVATTLTTLGRLLTERGDHDEAVPLLTEAIRINRVRLGEAHPNVALALNDLGTLHVRRGDLGAAEPLLEQALALRERALGPDHPYVAVSLSNLATVRVRQGRVAEALPLRRRALAIARAALGNAHDNTGIYAYHLADALSRLGQVAEAEPLYSEAAAILSRAFPGGHAFTARALAGHGELLLRTDRRAEAEALLRRALAIYRDLGAGEDAARIEALLAPNPRG